MGPTVLILTHSGDHYVIERVAEALVRRGARAVRFDTDSFPSEARLSARVGGRSSHCLRICGAGTGDDREGDTVVDLSTVSAVWARKIWAPRMDERLDARMRAGAERESAAALLGFLDGLAGARQPAVRQPAVRWPAVRWPTVRWIDPPDVVRSAENKLRQLRIAEEIGLDVPRTLMTNDPEAVRAFREENGEIVAKMLTPLSVGMEQQSFFVRTTRIRDEHLEHLDGLRHAPMVFQELVPKAMELRIACVGARTFTGGIDASESERGKVDWRGARPDETGWVHADLPGDVAARIGSLLSALGLRYGAVDLVRTPEGRHVFLEINPCGEWGMLERDLGLPIADALAEELLRPDAASADAPSPAAKETT